MDWTFKVSDLAIVFATLVGPILAVQAQGWLDSRREERRRRLGVFNALMRTRANPVSPEHVNALNAVPLEYQGGGQSVKDVRAAWRIYINHFGKDTTTPTWGERRLELLTTLLQRMGKSLKYDLDAVEIERDAYSPQAHGLAAAEQDLIRQGLAAIFRGEKTLPLSVEKMPTDPQMVQRWVVFMSKVESYIDSQLGPKSDGDQAKPATQEKTV